MPDTTAVSRLHNADIRVRLQAVSDLVAAGKPAVPMLIAALADAAPEARWRSIVALGWISDREAVEPLIGALADSVWEVRQNAAWALGQIGDRRAVAPLWAALHDEDEQVSVLAAYALVHMGIRVEPALHSDNEHARRAASAALSLPANNAEHTPITAKTHYLEKSR